MNDTPRPASATRTANSAAVDPQVAQAILAAVASLQYGSVEVVVHEGRVVQLDKRERVRLGNTQSPTASAAAR